MEGANEGKFHRESSIPRIVGISRDSTLNISGKLSVNLRRVEVDGKLILFFFLLTYTTNYKHPLQSHPLINKSPSSRISHNEPLMQG